MFSHSTKMFGNILWAVQDKMSFFLLCVCAYSLSHCFPKSDLSFTLISLVIWLVFFLLWCCSEQSASHSFIYLLVAWEYYKRFAWFWIPGLGYMILNIVMSPISLPASPLLCVKMFCRLVVSFLFFDFMQAKSKILKTKKKVFFSSQTNKWVMCVAGVGLLSWWLRLKSIKVCYKCVCALSNAFKSC